MSAKKQSQAFYPQELVMVKVRFKNRRPEPFSCDWVHATPMRDCLENSVAEIETKQLYSPEKGARRQFRTAD
jgi:hypothetical protein